MHGGNTGPDSASCTPSAAVLVGMAWHSLRVPPLLMIIIIRLITLSDTTEHFHTWRPCSCCGKCVDAPCIHAANCHSLCGTTLCCFFSLWHVLAGIYRTKPKSSLRLFPSSLMSSFSGSGHSSGKACIPRCARLWRHRRAMASCIRHSCARVVECGDKCVRARVSFARACGFGRSPLAASC